MGNLIKAKEEDTNVELYNKFMNNITVLDYSCVSREHYLSSSNLKKEGMIRNYYTDMKARSSGFKFVFLSCLV